MSDILDKLYYERLNEWSDIQGHLEFMHDLVVGTAAADVVELGVRSGNSTAALLAAVDKTDGHLWSVDIDHVEMPPAFNASGRHTLIIGNDLEVANSDWMPLDIDICFIDTVHWYHHTLNELLAYGSRSDIILLHDTELEYPYMAPPGDPPFPVKQAVLTYVATMDRPVEWRTGSYGMAVIRR